MSFLLSIINSFRQDCRLRKEYKILEQYIRLARLY